MALVIKPSVDWPRRTEQLTGLEDLLKQNPVEDADPQEERIPSALLADYTLNTYLFADPSGDQDFYTGNTVADYFNHISHTIVDLVVSGAISTLVDNLDGTYTHNNGVGIIRTINVNAINSYIVDTANYYTGNTVEEALAQIGQNLDVLTNLSVTQKVLDYTLTDNDDIILVNASGGAITIQPHDATTAKVKKYTIKVINFDNAVDVTPSVGNIDALGSYNFSTNKESITIVPFAGDWYII